MLISFSVFLPQTMLIMKHSLKPQSIYSMPHTIHIIFPTFGLIRQGRKKKKKRTAKVPRGTILFKE